MACLAPDSSPKRTSSSAHLVAARSIPERSTFTAASMSASLRPVAMNGTGVLLTGVPPLIASVAVRDVLGAGGGVMVVEVVKVGLSVRSCGAVCIAGFDCWEGHGACKPPRKKSVIVGGCSGGVAHFLRRGWPTGDRLPTNRGCPRRRPGVRCRFA